MVNGPDFLRNEELLWLHVKFQRCDIQKEEELKPCMLISNNDVKSFNLADFLPSQNWRVLFLHGFNVLLGNERRRISVMPTCTKWELLRWNKVPQKLPTNFQVKPCISFGPISKSLRTNRWSNIFACWCQKTNYYALKTMCVRVNTAIPSSKELPPKYGHYNQWGPTELLDTKIKCLYKSVVRRSVVYRQDKAKPSQPQLGQLPPDRITQFVRPFTKTGVDLFGPFNITIGRRVEKRLAVIFTCLTVWAARIELAKDLPANSFILCLRNL